MPTKRIFDLVVLTGLGVHLAMSTLVKPWARYRQQTSSGAAQVAAEALVRAA